MKGIVFTVRRKKPTERSRPALDTKAFQKKYGIYILLSVFLILGVAFGAALSENPGVSRAFNGFFGIDVATQADSEIITVFSANFCACFVLLLAAFLFGTSAAGTPFLPFVIAVKGIGIGTSATSLFADFGVKGIVFYLLTCLAGDVLFLIALYKESRRAISLSSTLAKSLFLNKTDVSYTGDDIKDFVTHSSYMLLLTVVSAAVNTSLRYIFAGISGVL